MKGPAAALCLLDPPECCTTQDAIDNADGNTLSSAVEKLSITARPTDPATGRSLPVVAPPLSGSEVEAEAPGGGVTAATPSDSAAAGPTSRALPSGTELDCEPDSEPVSAVAAVEPPTAANAAQAAAQTAEAPAHAVAAAQADKSTGELIRHERDEKERRHAEQDLNRALARSSRDGVDSSPMGSPAASSDASDAGSIPNSASAGRGSGRSGASAAVEPPPQQPPNDMQSTVDSIAAEASQVR